jgi:hypothetical protein
MNVVVFLFSSWKCWLSKINNPRQLRFTYSQLLICDDNKILKYIIVILRLKARIVERIDASIAGQQRSKHSSEATDPDATIEDTVFSVLSVPRLYKLDQLDKRVSGYSVGDRSRWLALLICIVNSRYLATTNEQIDYFMCSAVVIYRVEITDTVAVTWSYES